MNCTNCNAPMRITDPDHLTIGATVLEVTGGVDYSPTCRHAIRTSLLGATLCCSCGITLPTKERR